MPPGRTPPLSRASLRRISAGSRGVGGRAFWGSREISGAGKNECARTNSLHARVRQGRGSSFGRRNNLFSDPPNPIRSLLHPSRASLVPTALLEALKAYPPRTSRRFGIRRLSTGKRVAAFRQGSHRERHKLRAGDTICQGFSVFRASARMWSGVVPQQPPTNCAPASSHLSAWLAKSSGEDFLSGRKFPSWFGCPRLA